MDNAKDNPPFKEVLKTYNYADVAFVKSLFEENEIVYYVNNENVNLVGGLMFAEPMRVMVESAQYEFVQELLKEFQSRFMSFTAEDVPELRDEDDGISS
jgi:predicted RNA methylase